MKNILKVLSAVVLICVSVNAEGVMSAQEERVKKVKDLYFDAFAYGHGPISPNNGHYPLSKRIMDWNVEAQKLSDAEKNELIPEVEKINTRFTDSTYNRNDITARQAYDFNLMSLYICCPLSQELCNKLNDSNTAKADKIFDAEQAAQEAAQVARK